MDFQDASGGATASFVNDIVELRGARADFKATRSVFAGRGGIWLALAAAAILGTIGISALIPAISPGWVSRIGVAGIGGVLAASAGLVARARWGSRLLAQAADQIRRQLVDDGQRELADRITQLQQA